MRPQRILSPRRDPLQSDPTHVSLLVRIVHQQVLIGPPMAPIWPFGKKKQLLALEEEAPSPIVYRKTDDTEQQDAQTEQQQADYKAALSFFGNGEANVKRAEEQSQRYDGIVASSQQTTPIQHESEPDSGIEWVHHTDGYHYQRQSDGSFDPVAHVRDQQGAYHPYS